MQTNFVTSIWEFLAESLRRKDIRWESRPLQWSCWSKTVVCLWFQSPPPQRRCPMCLQICKCRFQSPGDSGTVDMSVRFLPQFRCLGRWFDPKYLKKVLTLSPSSKLISRKKPIRKLSFWSVFFMAECFMKNIFVSITIFFWLILFETILSKFTPFWHTKVKFQAWFLKKQTRNPSLLSVPLIQCSITNIFVFINIFVQLIPLEIILSR